MAKRQSVLKEFLVFAMTNKKWWLIPMALIISLMASLALLASTPIAPFIYTLF